MPSKKPSITIRLSEEEYRVLQKWAESEYRTVPSLVLAFTKKQIDEYKEKHSKNSWEFYQMTNTPEQPPSVAERLDRLEAIFADMAEVVVNNAEVTDRHNEVLIRLEEQTARNASAIERLTATTERLAAEAAQDRQQAAIDRQSFQTEIQRIWEYLLGQSGNGRNAWLKQLPRYQERELILMLTAISDTFGNG